MTEEQKHELSQIDKLKGSLLEQIANAQRSGKQKELEQLHERIDKLYDRGNYLRNLDVYGNQQVASYRAVKTIIG